MRPSLVRALAFCVPWATLAFVTLRVSCASAQDLVPTPTVAPAAITTPTPDATVSALQVEKLRLETVKLQIDTDATVTALQREKLERESTKLGGEIARGDNWFWTNGTVLATAVATVIALGQFLRTRGDQINSQIAQANEERFKAIVEGLGSDEGGLRVGGIISLRRFLQPRRKWLLLTDRRDPRHANFYVPAFNLAAAHLRLQQPPTSALPSPIDAMTLDLGRVLADVYPLARTTLSRGSAHDALNASRVYLDEARLGKYDLAEIWLPECRLVRANLEGAHLCRANLSGSNLTGAGLSSAWLIECDFSAATLIPASTQFVRGKPQANLSNARIGGADFSGADLTSADLSSVSVASACPQHPSRGRPADFSNAKLSDARLSGADLRGAKLQACDLTDTVLANANLAGCNLVGANLTGADLTGADLRGADLKDAQLDDVLEMDGLRLQDAIGLSLSREQQQAWENRGVMC